MNPVLRIAVFAAGGWLAGELTARMLSSSRSDAPQFAVAEAATEVPLSPWGAFLHSRGALREGSRQSLTADEMRMSAVALEKPDGALAMSERFSTAQAAEFPALLAIVAAIRDPHLRLQTTEVLFAAWVEKDALAAINAGKTYPALAASAMRAAVRAWAEHDRPALLAWLRSRISSGTRQAAEEPAMQILSRYYPEDALNYAMEIDNRSTTGRKLFLEWRAKDEAAAESWFATAPEATRFALYPDWLNAQPGSPAEKWNLVMASAPDDYRRSEGLGIVLDEWKKTDQGAALKALTALPEKAWGRKLAYAAGAMLADAGSSEEEIFALIPAKYQDSFWISLTDAALGAPGRTRPEDAARYFKNIPLENVERQRLAAHIATALAYLGDAADASEWVSSLPRDHARDLAAADLARYFSRSDPNAARAWAEDIQDAKIREDVLRMFPQ